MFFSLVAIIALAAAEPATAAEPAPKQVIYRTGQTRIETDGAVEFVIGQGPKGAFFRLLNKSGERRVIDVKIQSAEQSGKTENLVYVLRDYALADTIFLEDISRGKFWLAGWSSRPAKAEEGPTWTRNRDAEPLWRDPPTYPYACMETAGPHESVVVNFDVDETGATQDIEAIETTNDCLVVAARESVAQWLYAPAIRNGRPSRREDVQTSVRFELSD
ncbi:MAG: energy transducer TonB [Parvularculaceae bacterium]